jgi:hypothetical protein
MSTPLFMTAPRLIPRTLTKCRHLPLSSHSTASYCTLAWLSSAQLSYISLAGFCEFTRAYHCICFILYFPLAYISFLIKCRHTLFRSIFFLVGGMSSVHQPRMSQRLLSTTTAKTYLLEPENGHRTIPGSADKLPRSLRGSATTHSVLQKPYPSLLGRPLTRSPSISGRPASQPHLGTI